MSQRRSLQTMQEGSDEYNRCILYNQGDLCSQLSLNISNDLQERRLQLLGYKLYSQCAKGYRGIQQDDLNKRTQLINQRYKSTLTPAQVGQMCALKHTPTTEFQTRMTEQNDQLVSSVESNPHRFKKLLYMSEPELQALDILEQTSKMNYQFINNMLIGHLTNPWFDLQLGTVVRDFHVNFWVSLNVAQARFQTILSAFAQRYKEVYPQTQLPDLSRVMYEQIRWIFVSNEYKNVQTMNELYNDNLAMDVMGESEEWKFHKHLRDSLYHDLVVHYLHLDRVGDDFVFTIDQAVFLVLDVWLKSSLYWKTDTCKFIQDHLWFIVQEIFPDIVYKVLQREPIIPTSTTLLLGATLVHDTTVLNRIRNDMLTINEQDADLQQTVSSPVSQDEEEDFYGYY